MSTDDVAARRPALAAPAPLGLAAEVSCGGVDAVVVAVDPAARSLVPVEGLTGAVDAGGEVANGGVWPVPGEDEEGGVAGEDPGDVEPGAEEPPVCVWLPEGAPEPVEGEPPVVPPPLPLPCGGVEELVPESSCESSLDPPVSVELDSPSSDEPEPCALGVVDVPVSPSSDSPVEVPVDAEGASVPSSSVSWDEFVPE